MVRIPWFSAIRRTAVVAVLGVVLATCGVASDPDISMTAGPATTTSAGPTSTTSTSAPPPEPTFLAADDDRDGVVRVVLWGDSLAFEAREHFLLEVTAHGGIVAETRTCGGVAICDFLDELAERAGEVEVALLEFSGNSMWTCMVDPATGAAPRGEAVVARYEADLATAVASLVGGGARVVLVGAPPAGFEGPDGERAGVRAMYERFAAQHADVAFVDAGAVVLDGGRYADALPCLPFEDASLGCSDGRIAVRNADQLHLCPSPHVGDPFLGRCDLWSSGAYRYGTAMAHAALAAAGVLDGAPVGSGPDWPWPSTGAGRR